MSVKVSPTLSKKEDRMGHQKQGVFTAAAAGAVAAVAVAAAAVAAVAES